MSTPINLGLRSNVGRAQPNGRDDVLLVQRLLNMQRQAPLKPLREDGICGGHTIAAIVEFQQRVVKMMRPDGVVAASGHTFALLSKTTAPQLPTTGLQIAWGSKVTPEFKSKVVAICRELQINPDYLMSCMAFESAGTFSPSVKNAAGSGAIGLIQFMPKTAVSLGTTTPALAAMTAVQQLDYVKKYFLPYKGRLKTLEDVYMAIFTPKGIGKPQDYQLYTSGSKAYAQNKGFDANKDGSITPAEISAKVRQKYTQGMTSDMAG